jgi:SAM-dependent methyltransferase
VEKHVNRNLEIDIFLRDYASSDLVFKPTGTTKLLLEATQEFLIPSLRILDLGCGSGVIAANLKLNEPSVEMFASDFSANAVHFAQRQFEEIGIEVQTSIGDCLDPWKGSKPFDLIVSDISGISENLAPYTNWFDGVPCATGKDGTLLTIKVLADAGACLADAGLLIMPIISLSNQEAILNTAARFFRQIQVLGSQDWPLNNPSADFLRVADSLESQGLISLKKRFGILQFTTTIYKFSN